ncbi:CapA family protein [Lactiplantibacillus modestisalitolerans]|uniref:CapA family protein n=1 Tax=Lactiplantibacillus modestisalitolerans TaxID=1457219 RepID=A0ABV5WT48_9LACO|nr:CapA family protein [Lactiplantibacillus modestisalitolerans]
MKPLTFSEIATIVGGQWVTTPNDLETTVQHYAVYSGELRRDIGANNLLFAMSHEHWLKGTLNTGVYTNTFKDNHANVRRLARYLKMAIVEYPVPTSPVPQLVVPNGYDALERLVRVAAKRYVGKNIAVTGSVGKSTTKTFIADLLQHVGPTMSSVGNHNSRTSVKVQMMNHEESAFNVLEIAGISVAYSEPDTGIGGVASLMPMDVAVLTQINAGQKGWSPRKTADMKTRIGVNLKGRPFVVNAEIKNLADVRHDVHRYTDQLITYGLTPDCDYYGTLAADGQLTIHHHEKTLGVIDAQGLDHGTVSDMVAALTVYDLEGGQMTPDVMAAFSKTAHQTTTHKVARFKANGRQVTVIDDTHNAELLSIENFIDYAENYPAPRTTRKIFIEGRVRDLRQFSYATHSQVVAQLNQTHLDRVYLYGPEMNWVIPKLVATKFGGYYTTPRQVLEAVAREPQQDLVIFIKADRRASTIDQIRDLLVRRLDYQASAASQFAISTAQPQALHYNHNGVGRLLVILRVLQRVAQGKLRLTQAITITTDLAQDPSVNKVSLKSGRAYTVYDLLTLAIVAPAPDVVINLAIALFGSNRRAMIGLRKMATQLQVNAEAVGNITGRFTRRPQRTTLQDLEKIGAAYCQLPNEVFSLLASQRRTFAGRLYQKKTQLLKTHQIVGSVFQESQEHAGLMFTQDSQGKRAIAFINSPHTAYVDARVADWTATNQPLPSVTVKEMSLAHPIINLLADTYFGESYTRQRQRRGVDDALQRYGYDYSFKKIESFFKGNVTNGLNFEAVFATGTSPLHGIKPFVLDAAQQPTLQELKRVGFDFAMLGNNHANDYGPERLTATIQTLRAAGIETIGAGATLTEARTALTFNYQQQPFVFFNGYWYRNAAANLFDFYATSHHAGVNCLDSTLVDDIKSYKQAHPQATVIVNAHWGTDFATVDRHQRASAQRLAAAGADLIIGHGPHRLQPIDYVGRVPVLYSIGNGVFNSNGEFKKRQVPGYGAVLRLDLARRKLFWCPIKTNNLETFWQPTFVTDQTFTTLCQANPPRFETTKLDGNINAVVVPF